MGVFLFKSSCVEAGLNPAPKVSVVMPVRNLAPFVGASIASILAQSFRDFEFLILDDGSTDGTTAILRDWAARDSRIRLYEGQGCLGPAGSSNFVVGEARAPLIARMDGDDISHPDRLRSQVDALQENPNACLMASLWEGIDETGRRVRPRDRASLDRLSPFAPFPHGSIMFRREAFDACGGYRRQADFWEDLDLYGRMSGFGELLVLPASLYQHRASPLSTRLTSARAQVERSVDRMFRQALQRPAGTGAGADKLLPQVFVSLGSTLVWAGRRPNMFRRMLTHGEMQPNFGTAAALAWALWGAISPRTLRLCLAQLVARRDRRAGRRTGGTQVFAWTPTIVDDAGENAQRPIERDEPLLPHPHHAAQPHRPVAATGA
jgi:GT2 family glycosyltransferase